MSATVAPVYVQPVLNYQVSSSGDEVYYHVTEPKKNRIAVFRVLSMPFLFVGIIALFFGLPVIFTSGSQFPRFGLPIVITLIVCFGVPQLFTYFANQKTSIPIKFDRKGFTFKGNSYAWEHVRGFNYYGDSGFFAVGASMIAAAKFNFATSGYVYFTYGSQEIRIVQHLPPELAEKICNEIVECARKVGY